MSGDDQIRVERGGLGSIKVYDVTADELDILEKGEPNSALKDWGLMLAPIGAAYIPVLIFLEKPEENIIKFILFSIATAVSLVAGIICFSIWWRGRGVTESVIVKIKGRMKPIPLDTLPPLVNSDPRKGTNFTETEGEAAPS